MKPQQTMKPKIIFFFRRFNDIDHMTPVIDRLAETGRFEIKLFSITPGYEISKDPRLSYLTTVRQIPTRFLHMQSRRWLTRLYGRAISWAHGTQSRIASALRNKFLNLTGSKLSGRIYGRAWAREFLDRESPSLLIFDWQRPKIATALSLVAEAEKRGIPKVALPHGADIVTNTVLTWTAQSAGSITPWGKFYADFDRVVVPNQWRARSVTEGGYPVERIDILGSARFSEGGRQILDRCLATSRYAREKTQEKMRFLFMDQDPLYLLYPDRILSTLERLAKLPYIDLVFKPSTATLGRSDRAASTRMSELPLTLATDVPTIELVKWAQVVSGVVTSAIMEAFLQEKELIIPSYMEENKTVFSEYGVSWEARSEEEFFAIVERIWRGEKWRSPDPQAREKLIREWVQGGRESKDVLSNYVQYIEKMSKAPAKQASP